MIGALGHIGFIDHVGATGAAWFNAPEFSDDAIIMDFERGRYAMPALDDSSNPILTRVNGKFPKRAVSITDILSITRQLPNEGSFSGTTWRTNPTGEPGNWSLIGGDGYGAGVPRLERWLGTQGLWVDPTQRFNRVPNAESIPALPRTVTMSRGTMAYTVSWVGNDDLICTVSGHSGATQTLTARTSDPTQLNWGYLPVIASWNGQPTVIAAAGNPGCIAHSLCSDTQSSSTLFRPPATMIVTSPYTAAGEVHTERGPEHVKFSAAVMAIINRDVGVTDGMRTGTLIVDQHQLKEPDTDSRKVALGGGMDAAAFGQTYLGFHDTAGAVTFQSNSGDGNNLSIATTAAASRSRCKLGMTIERTSGIRQRRAAMQGFGAASTVVAQGGNDLWGNPAFWLNTCHANSATDYPALVGGSGPFYSIKWSPEFLSEAQLLAAVGD